MSRQKKNGRKNCPVEKIVLATAILNLVTALIDFIKYPAQLRWEGENPLFCNIHKFRFIVNTKECVLWINYIL